MTTFEELGLSKGLLDDIKNAGFIFPTEIQEKTIPLVVAGKDVIAVSATGSGKTLAYGAGIIEKIKRGQGLQALILTPTRELAEQVANNLRIFSKHSLLNIKEVYGGVDIVSQLIDSRYSEIIVGTPGRLLDIVRKGKINFSAIKFIVLDEADKMLNAGFIKDVENLINKCPKVRQILLFSVTISPEVKKIAERYAKQYVEINMENQIDSSKLYQAYYNTERNEKFALLVHLLKLEKGIVMVFCNSRKNVDNVTMGLQQQGLSAIAIHGGLIQEERTRALQSFSVNQSVILVCTDLAARGLDISNISQVYNYDIPLLITEYLHRIGRTARAGKKGVAISFVSSGNHTEFNQILKQNKNIEKLVTPKFNLVFIDFSTKDHRSRKPKPNNQKSKKGYQKLGPYAKHKGRKSHGKHIRKWQKNIYRKRSPN